MLFALVFALFAVTAASANYFLLRRAINDQSEFPSNEEFQVAMAEVAAELDRPVPEIFTVGSEGQFVGVDGEPTQGSGAAGTSISLGADLFPMRSRVLRSGELAIDAVDSWLATRIAAPPGSAALNIASSQPPADAAGFDALVLGMVGGLELDHPGLTPEWLGYLENLRDENDEPLFSGQVAGDGDICEALFVNCQAALDELNELLSMANDDQFVELMDRALILAGERTRDRALASQLQISGLVALVSTAVAALAAWLVTRRMLQPIAELTEAARGASADNLDLRIDRRGPDDELKRLADTFDGMLARLQASFESSQRFGSNAAHELKTPLAIMRAEIDASRADPQTSDRERLLLDRLEAAADRSERLVGSLLDLARAEGRPDLADRVDLADIMSEALLDQASLLSERGLTVDYVVRDTVVRDTVVRDNAVSGSATETVGDAALLHTLAHNLVENAGKYATAGSELLIAVEAVGGKLRLRVENDSEPIDVDHPAELVEPFNRAAARVGADGHGLGLSIVGAIARAHDAPVDVAFRPNGCGLRVTVDFEPAPVADPQ